MNRSKKEVSIVGAAILLLAAASVSIARYSGGTGEPNYPYRIATPNDLNDIGNHVEDFNKCFVMVNDIDLADFTGTEFNIIGPSWGSEFTGVFDGNGHSVINFTWDHPGPDYVRNVGLFGIIGLGGEIRNIGMENADVNGGPASDFVGSLIGFNDLGEAVNCFTVGGTVRGTTNVGGLVGYCWEGSVSRCYSTGTVWGDSYGIGGLVGISYDGPIENCYSMAAVSGDSKVGGLTGSTLASVTDCYSTGPVSGASSVGGLVGDSGSSSEAIVNSFWDAQTSDCNTSDGGTGKTTDEMMTESTFTDAGWDFVEVWGIGQSQTYPFLRKHITGDLNHDGIVDGRDFAIFALHWMEGE